jgi:hypothetical protein
MVCIKTAENRRVLFLFQSIKYEKLPKIHARAVFVPRSVSRRRSRSTVRSIGSNALFAVQRIKLLQIVPVDRFVEKIPRQRAWKHPKCLRENMFHVNPDRNDNVDNPVDNFSATVAVALD